MRISIVLFCVKNCSINIYGVRVSFLVLEYNAWDYKVIRAICIDFIKLLLHVLELLVNGVKMVFKVCVRPKETLTFEVKHLFVNCNRLFQIYTHFSCNDLYECETKMTL